jgi:hypothetical protein
LATKLASGNLAANTVGLRLEMSDGTLLTPQRKLKQATQAADKLHRQLLHLLQTCQFQTAVVDLTVTVTDLIPVEIRQLSLFDFAQVSKRATLEQVVAELTDQYESKLFVYGVPAQSNSRLPERRYKWRKLAGSRNTAFFRWPSEQVFPLAEGDTFTGFVWQGQRHVIDTIVKAWSVECGWWEVQTRRDYYKIRTSSGLLLTIYHEYQADKWLIERIYN